MDMSLTPTGSILTVQDLHHEFREKPAGSRGRRVKALRGVTLELRAGECLGLVGESGSGKTTLARLILRLIKPTRGSVLFYGQNVFSMDREDLKDFRRRVQIVFQDPFGSLNPRLRAGRMLEEVLLVHREGTTPASRREKAAELLALVGLQPDAMNRFPHEFSGGQRQRLGIARALSVDPEVLVLDEPVSALDLSVQAQILNLLAELKDSLGLSYLFITHDLSVVRQVADWVGVLYLGKIVEIGRTHRVFADPMHPYTRGLLAAATPPEEITGEKARWTLLPGEPASPLEPPTGCAFHPRCPHPSKDPVCGADPPPLSEVEGGREAACWKAREHLTGP
jgi:oligopeptide/dipeptide ABC transporter ATP-binding protein